MRDGEKNQTGLWSQSGNAGVWYYQGGGNGGHFLDKDHTFDHFRTEFYQPQLSNRDDFVSWQAKGSPQSMQTANKKYKDILETYEAPELPADVDKDLLKFIENLG